MRKILFRGKDKDTGNWFYGSYFKHQKTVNYFSNGDSENNYQHLIITDGLADWHMSRPIDRIEVDENTVGQSTGLYDSENNEIFEGDILGYKITKGMSVDAPIGTLVCREIMFKSFNYEEDKSPSDTMSAGFIALNRFFIGDRVCEYAESIFELIYSFKAKVVGNIHDNPELLKGE